MGKIVIIEEKADMIVDKLEKMKYCAEDLIECFVETMEGHRDFDEDDDDDDWDDEYEVKRRRGSRRGSRGGMRRGMRRGGSTSRY